MSCVELHRAKKEYEDILQEAQIKPLTNEKKDRLDELASIIQETTKRINQILPREKSIIL